MIISYHINQINAPVVGSLSCVSSTTAYLYEVLLNYSSLPIISGQPSSLTIQSVEEVFLQVMIPSFPGQAKSGPNRQ